MWLRSDDPFYRYSRVIWSLPLKLPIPEHWFQWFRWSSYLFRLYSLTFISDSGMSRVRRTNVISLFCEFSRIGWEIRSYFGYKSGCCCVDYAKEFHFSYPNIWLDVQFNKAAVVKLSELIPISFPMATESVVFRNDGIGRSADAEDYREVVSRKRNYVETIVMSGELLQSSIIPSTSGQ